MTRRNPSSQARQVQAIRALGGVRLAARAEQLRARGVEAGKVAVFLGITADALANYYALQDELPFAT